ATPGIESMAETGGKSAFTAEINAAIADGDAGVVISGGGIGRSPGGVAVGFETTAEYPLLTLVSMIAPSPDWFVGVSDLPLASPTGIWKSGATVDLLPWDSGTDSGVNYTSSNVDANPQIPIALITDAPFDSGDPLGTFTIELVPDFNDDGAIDGDDLNDPSMGWEVRFGADLDGGALLALQRHFDGGGGRVNGNLGFVPEPTSAALWVVGLGLTNLWSIGRRLLRRRCAKQTC
ncbi:MAG: spondin domain-containing protein, partial [Planctomycetota bacterium]